MMRILVCGGRDYANGHALDTVLDAIHAQRPVTRLIDGVLRGADSLAAAWARSRGIPTLPFPADWNKHGKAAGFLRNATMLREGMPRFGCGFPRRQGDGAHGQAGQKRRRGRPGGRQAGRRPGREPSDDARHPQRRAPRRRPPPRLGYRVIIGYGKGGFWVRNPDMTRPPFVDGNSFIAFRKAKVRSLPRERP